MKTPAKLIEREFLLAFWKLHILHHAGQEAVVGQWLIRELREHGYEVSPGTLYPLLARMQARGWLRCQVDPRGGARARRAYRLTGEGRSVLKALRRRLEELYREVSAAESPVRGTPPESRRRRRR